MQAKEEVKTTVVLPAALHESLKIRGIKERKTISDVTAKALTLYLSSDDQVQASASA